MAITTSVARHYAIRMNVIAIVCVAFAAWGAWDLWVKIPRQEAIAAEYDQIAARLSTLEAEASGGRALSEAEKREVDDLTRRRNTIMPRGQAPKRPATFDRLTCWFFIACLPFAPYFFWRYRATRARVYRLDLDERGAPAVLVTPEGSWPIEDITDIDMSRWMARSIAFAVHRDERRIKLDAYLYHDLHRIVGALAVKFHPDRWDDEARLKRAAEPTDEEPLAPRPLEAAEAPAESTGAGVSSPAAYDR